MSYPYPELREEAMERLEHILDHGEVEGHRLQLGRGHETKWAPPVNSEWFGIPDGNGKYVVAPATVAIDPWLRLQSRVYNDDFDFSSWKTGASRSTIEKMQRNPRSAPTPVLEVQRDGTVKRQEGRARAIGAKRAGLSRMPIWVAVQVYR